MMKSILTTIAFLALAVSGLAQTRSVIVNTGGVIQSPTNFWSANATNARSGLGLGTAATNAASAFQPSSVALSNLAAGNGGSLTNITATIVGTNVAISNVVGLQTALDGKLATNGSANGLTNFPTLNQNTTGTASNVTGVVALANGGTGATNAASARTSLGATTVGANIFTLSNPDEIRFLRLNANNSVSALTALDMRTALSVGTNLGTVTSIGMTVPAIFSLSTPTITSSGTFALTIANQTSRQVFIAPNGGGVPAFRGVESDDLPSLAISKITGLQTALDGKLATGGTATLATNVTGVVALANGGTGGTDAATARTGLGATTAGSSMFTLVNPSAIRFLRLNNDNTMSALSDSDFRTAIGLGAAATNPASAFQPSSGVLSNLSSSNAVNLTNIPATNIVGTVALASNISGTLAISNGGTGATNAATARTNLGLTFSALTNSDSNSFRSAIGLGISNSVSFDEMDVRYASFEDGGSGVVVNSNGISLFGTNVANVRGFTRTSLGLGSTDSVTFGPAILSKLNLSNSSIDIGATSSTTVDLTYISNSLLSVGLSGVSFGSTSFAAVTRTNLGLGYLGTNAVTTRTNLGLGATNDVIFRSITSGNDSATKTIIIKGDEIAVQSPVTTAYSNTIISFPNQSTITMHGELSFSTNAFATTTRTNLGLGYLGTNAVTTRTNLGLGWSALTNSNTATALVGYNTNNGNVVMPSSLTFSNNAVFSQSMSATTNSVSAGGTLFAGSGSTISFYAAEDQSGWRTNLGLGWAALTNTNTSGFNASLYGSGTNPVLYNTNGEVVSPTNFWQVAPIVTRFVEFDPPTNATTNIVAARNLHIHSLAISRTGVTSTIALPTNNVFNGDIALVVHEGPTSSVTQVRTQGSTNNFVTMNRTEEAVEFVYYNSVWQFNHNRSFVEPIYFSGTNAAGHAAESRTNLGIPLAALTNTNAAGFQQAIFSTNAPTNAANFGDRVTWLEVSVLTNGVTNSFKIPLYK